jgi:putative CocE/NonD family hydrolase
MADETGKTAEKDSVRIKWGIKIPMRDGVRLNGTLYLPENQKEPRPAIFAFTPYIGEREHPEGLTIAGGGYPYITVDVRGRGNSEGDYAPFFSDPNDGHDLVEWLARQPYCNGKVGARGLSYVGYTQWATVRGDPQHLATIVPSAPCWVGLDYPFRFNIFLNFTPRWLMLVWGNALQQTMHDDAGYWNKRQLSFYESNLPFRKMDEFFGFESKPFHEWLEHPHQEAYWDRANPTPEQFARLTMPILTLTGIYDGDQPGAMEFHKHHLEHAGDKANHYLVIGPWDHPGVRKPQAEFMGFKCGPASLVDMGKLHCEWYAWTMEDGPKPEFLKNKVAHYVMVAEKWRYANTLEEVTARIEPMYLRSITNPTDVFQSGTLAATPDERSEPDHYVYDPRDLTLPRIEASGSLDDVDYGALTNTLTYHSAPFNSDTEVTGFFKLSAWIAIDQPDTDFNIVIFDVAPEGSAVYLASQPLRARYRQGLRVEKLIDTKEPLLYEFDRLFFVSRQISKGHRLRLVFGANHTIHFQKNYNSGKPIADETMDDARTVTVRLFHDAKYPSVLHVPIGRPGNN